MGDDLIFAQDFVDTTTKQMSDFFAQSERPATDTLMAAMGHVQSGAKRLHARGIYQSAQSVITCLNAVPLSLSALDGRLLALNKVVAQYADGLSDLNAALADNAALDDAVKSPADALILTETIAADTPLMPANDYAAAKQTLLGVMSFADKDEVAALTRMMDAAEQKPSHQPDILIDSVMRDIVQDALAIARMCAKTISVSYDVGRHSASQSAMPNLQVRISRTLRAIIMETLPLEKVGHIDLTCDGAALRIEASGPAPQFAPEGVMFDSLANDKLIASLPLIIPMPESDADAPRRMITDETEGELRAQLSQLMDGPATAANGLALDNDVLAEVGT